MDLDELHTSRTVVIGAPADAIYDLIADVTRMGEWSPACTGATWDEGAGPTVGSWFTGHNVIEDDRTY
ncbi:MAG: SRPBCC family protein, partial [Acidimicrobiia bacterium]